MYPALAPERGNTIFSYISEAPMDFRWNRDNGPGDIYALDINVTMCLGNTERRRDTTFFRRDATETHYMYITYYIYIYT